MKGKLLIVDDEQLIRKGLAKMIEDCPVTWTTVGEAEDGREALELIAATNPDLVITDIRMPGMDGLELCEAISKMDRPIDVVVLTAHKDFQFAQTALRFGAIDFLLKPCSMEELTGTLKKAYASFTERREAQETHRAELRRLQEHNIRSWLLGLPLDERTAEQLCTEWQNKQLIALNVETYLPEGRDYRQEDAGLMQFAFHNVLTELFGLYGLIGNLVAVKRNLFALLLSSASTPPDDREACGGEKFTLGTGIHGSVQTKVGIGTNIAQRLRPEPEIRSFIERVKETASQLLGLTIKDVHFGERSAHELQGVLSGAGGEKTEGAQSNLQRSKAIQSELMAYIMQGKTEQLKQYLERFGDNVSRLDVHEAKIECLGLVMALVDIGRREFELEAEGEHAIGGLSRWMEDLRPIQRTEQAVEWAAVPIREFMWQFNAWLSGKNVNLFDKALRYIERNYNSCTIHDVAGHVHLSVSYFSNLFKKETGDSFTNYMTKFRLEKAKILLCNTNMKISEIAESVGYDDPNYFTTVVRQWLGCSPSEYRKQNADSQNV